MFLRKRVPYSIPGTSLSEVPTELSRLQLRHKDEYAEGLMTENAALLASQPDCPADALPAAGSYKSQQIKYYALEAQLSSDIMDYLGLGPIIYDSIGKYAPARHVHEQYASLSVESFCSNRKDKVLSSIVTFEDSGISENISIPDLRQNAGSGLDRMQLSPLIGEVRLFAGKTYAEIAAANSLDMNMDSTRFTGWVPPANQPIDEARFPGAYKVLGPNVPVLADLYVKMNPLDSSDGSTSPSFQQQPPSETIPVQQHQHAIQDAVLSYDKSIGDKFGIKFKYSLKCNVGLDETDSWAYATATECATKLEYSYIPCKCTKQALLSTELVVNSEIDTAKMEIEIEEPPKTLAQAYPSYTPVLALVYIGKPFSASSENEVEEPAGSIKPDDSYEEYVDD